MNKTLRYIGLAKKAGALVVGSAAVLDAVRKGSPGLVLLASDLSAQSKKKLITSCAYHKIPINTLEYGMSDLSDALGRSASVGAVAILKKPILHLFDPLNPLYGGQTWQNKKSN